MMKKEKRLYEPALICIEQIFMEESFMAGINSGDNESMTENKDADGDGYEDTNDIDFI